jgi:hypothetical protein
VVIDDHRGVAVEQAAQTRDGDLECFLSAFAAVAWPQVLRDQVDADRVVPMGGEQAQQLQRLARGGCQSRLGIHPADHERPSRRRK